MNSLEWIETAGKGVQDAVESALFQLGIARDELEFEIISEPKRGVLGLGRSEARIKARIKPASYSGKDEKKGRQRGPRSTRSTGERAEARPGTAGKGKTNKVESKKTVTSSNEKAIRQQKRKEPVPEAAERKPSNNKSRDRKDTKVEAERLEGTATEQRDQSAMTRPSVPVGEQAILAQDFLKGLMRSMEIDAELEANVDEDDEIAKIAVNGSGLGLLIGQKAATLSAIQELTRTYVQRKTGAANGKIILDIGGYKAKRKAALEEFSKKVAAQVIETGQENTLEPMNSADRKTVHDTLAEIDGVETKSVGEEPRRRIIVLPTSSN